MAEDPEELGIEHTSGPDADWAEIKKLRRILEECGDAELKEAGRALLAKNAIQFCRIICALGMEDALEVMGTSVDELLELSKKRVHQAAA